MSLRYVMLNVWPIDNNWTYIKFDIDVTAFLIPVVLLCTCVVNGVT